MHIIKNQSKKLTITVLDTLSIACVVEIILVLLHL